MITVLPDNTIPWSICRRVSQWISQQKYSHTIGGRRLRLHHFLTSQTEPGWRINTHAHSFYEAHIILAGEGIDEAHPDQCIGPGGVLFHAPNVAHSWTVPDSRMFRVTLAFSVEPLVKLPVFAPWPVVPELAWSVALIFEEAQQLAPGWQERTRAHLAIMLSRLLALTETTSETPVFAGEESHLISIVEQFVQDNLARPLTLDDIASHVGMSRRSLTGHFREETGDSVMRYVRMLRMERAAELLQTTQSTLAEIGTEVGIPEPAYFCNCFRQHFMVTPQQYRRQWQQVPVTQLSTSSASNANPA